MRTPTRAPLWTRAAAVTAVATVLAGCGTQASGPSTSAGSSPSAAAGSASASATELAGAVLGKDQAPAGTTYLAKQSGRQSLEDVLHSGPGAAAYRAQLTKAGFRGGYRSLFVGSPGLDALGSTQRSVASFALSFPNPQDAGKARTQLDASVTGTGQAVRRLPDPGLASADTALQSTLTALHGSTFYYSWQQGPVVRVLIDAGGTAATDASTSLALARSVAASPSTASAQAPVRSLVLARTKAPQGTSYVAAKSGPRKATDFGSPALAVSLRKLSLHAAYASLFLSPGLLKPHAGPATATTNVVSSEAQQYRSDSDASHAYHLFLDRQKKLFEGHAVTTLDSNGLGAEGFGFRYVDTKSTGDVVGISYLWRSGDLVLTLSVVGTSTFVTQKSVRALADTVDARLKK